MALEDGDYSGAFGGGGFSDFLDPAMGRILAENPEALINHFAAAGIPPPGPQFAENFAPRFDSAYPPPITDASPAPMIPPSGSIGGPSPYEQPASAYGPQSPERNIWDSIISGMQKSQAAGERATTGQPPLQPGKAPDRVPQGEPGRVPPTALGQSDVGVTTGPNPVAPLVAPQAAAPEDNTEGPYTPSTQYATVAGGTGEPGGETAALPARDPRKAAAEDTKDSALAKTVSALAGVKAPPAPPQPQLRPFAGDRAAAIPATSPIAALLAGVLAGSPGAAQQLRLAQAVGGR